MSELPKTVVNGNAEQRIRALLGGQLFAVLSTVGRGRPHCSLVGFATSKGLDKIYFATAKSTRKYHNLTDNPAAAMLMDDRVNRPEDVEKASALTAFGLVEEISPAHEAAYRESFLARQPRLEGFLYLPDTARLALAVDRYQLVSRFQRVEEYRPGS